MKYIKKFNELKSSTYRKVARKLSNLGHKDRAGGYKPDLPGGIKE